MKGKRAVIVLVIRIYKGYELFFVEYPVFKFL